MSNLIVELNQTKAVILTNQNEVKHRVAYQNSFASRKDMIAKQPSFVVSEILSVWGDTPTVQDPEINEIPLETPTPTIEARTAALESALLTLLEGGQSNV